MVAAQSAQWQWWNKACFGYFGFVFIHELTAVASCVRIARGARGIAVADHVIQVLHWFEWCSGWCGIHDLWLALVHIECIDRFRVLVSREGWQWRSLAAMAAGSYLSWHARSYQIFCGCVFLHRLWASPALTERSTVRMALICVFVAVRQRNLVSTLGLLLTSAATHDLWHCCQIRRENVLEPPQRQRRRARIALGVAVCGVCTVLGSSRFLFPQ
jgi:hypothetical protein